MTASKLKTDFPQLGGLSDDEVDSVLVERGLLGLFVRAHVKRLGCPRKAGRPAGQAKPKSVIQRRGRKSEAPLSANSTNIQLAELAQAYMDCIHCSGADAADVVLKNIAGSTNREDRRRLAKLISELPGRKHDRQVRNEAERPEPAHGGASDLGLVAMLNRYSQK